ncbi:MAG TPA: metallophosphoesterase [Cyclobacteriaceae bacterium]|nr:metallophosphoesterase [Cyclobacteriaceae bacterium]
MKFLISFLLVFFSICITVPASGIYGVVFIDANGNGIREKNEIGLKGVVVSDQITAVTTDANGFYQIANSKGLGYVFVSLPSGYKAVRNFFSKVNASQSNVQVDFAIIKTINPTRFKFIHASDTHISSQTLDRIAKFKAVADSVKPDFILVTGDLVKDALRVPEAEASSLFELYKNEILKFELPVWNVPGNHEIFGIERELSKVSKDNPLYGRKMYRHYFGPDYYSFNFGGIHFVALNSLEFEDLWYYGSIDSVQREWLKKDLAAVPPSTPVVTFQHVPFISGELSISGFTESGPSRTLEKEHGEPKFRHVVSNALGIITILRSHPFPLALAGHHHSRQLLYLETAGQQTRFEQGAAVIGPSDRGSIQFPSGVTVYDVENGEIDGGTFIILK